MDQPGNHVLLRRNQPAAADRMRELLARTVQDQFADQRSNAGTLEDIRQRVEGLEWLVKEVREREVTGLASQLDELGRRLDESAEKPPPWAESLAEHMEQLRSQVAPVAELHSLWADVGIVSENVELALPQLQSVCDTVGQAMAVLQTQDDRLTKLQQSVGKLQQSMESAASRFSRLDKAVAELTQRTGQLDKEISAVKGRAEVSFGALTAKVDQSAEATSRQLSQSLETMSATVEGLSGQVTGVSGQVDLIGGQVQAVHGRIERLDERLADTDDKLGSLDTRLEGVGARIDGFGSTFGDKFGQLDGRLDSAAGRVADVSGQLETLGRELAEIGGRVDTSAGQLAGQLEPLADELRSRPGHADVQEILAKIVDAARSDVNAQLGSLEETVLTLAEALLRPQGRAAGRPQERPEPRSESRPVPAPRDGAEPLAHAGQGQA
jgi:chromosome segregation ATPase